MKKFYLPLFVLMIFVSGNAWATAAVGRLESKTNCSSANEYYWVGVGKCVECDDGASDSIAGVVLGTAGGLVTSKGVKKNQVENGFEDIQCTIGGQAVAQWDDNFSVGTQF